MRVSAGFPCSAANAWPPIPVLPALLGAVICAGWAARGDPSTPGKGCGSPWGGALFFGGQQSALISAKGRLHLLAGWSRLSLGAAFQSLQNAPYLLSPKSPS